MRYPRLHFGDGGQLDLTEGVPELFEAQVEREWAAVHVRVEWMETPRGRLDHLLRKREAPTPRFRA